MKTSGATLRGLLVGASLVLVCGCAARERHFADRFVKPGEPKVSIGAQPVAAPPQSLADYARRLRELQSRARTVSTLLPTVESRDPRLAAALVQLAVHDTAENHRRVAAAYRDAGINDYAYRHLQRALRLDPCDADAYDALARLWRDWEQPDVALGEAYRGLHCRPESAPLYNTLGTVMQALGQVDNARQAFETALRIDRGAVYAVNNLCYLSLESGRAAAAQQACERALKLDPTMTAARTNLALALAMQGDVPGAERRFLESPDRSAAHYNVGVLRMSVRKYADAAKEFDAAVVASDLRNATARQRALQARRLAAAEQE